MHRKLRRNFMKLRNTLAQFGPWVCLAQEKLQFSQINITDWAWLHTLTHTWSFKFHRDRLSYDWKHTITYFLPLPVEMPVSDIWLEIHNVTRHSVPITRSHGRATNTPTVEVSISDFLVTIFISLEEKKQNSEQAMESYFWFSKLQKLTYDCNIEVADNRTSPCTINPVSCLPRKCYEEYHDVGKPCTGAVSQRRCWCLHKATTTRRNQTEKEIAEKRIW